MLKSGLNPSWQWRCGPSHYHGSTLAQTHGLNGSGHDVVWRSAGEDEEVGDEEEMAAATRRRRPALCGLVRGDVFCLEAPICQPYSPAPTKSSTCRPLLVIASAISFDGFCAITSDCAHPNSVSSVGSIRRPMWGIALRMKLRLAP